MPTEQQARLATVSWHRGTFAASDVESLDAILDRITREIDPELPQGIVVERSNGDALTVLLGAPKSFVSFVAASGDAPYFSSLGDPTATGFITFYVDGDHHSETESRRAISAAEARAAVREFVGLGRGLPRCITWTEVSGRLHLNLRSA
jgi:hypothetical protein